MGQDRVALRFALRPKNFSSANHVYSKFRQVTPTFRFPKDHRHGETAVPNRPLDRDHRDERTYWFALLEIAREQCNFEGAATAKRELERLGVRISYERPNSVREARHGR